MQINLYAKRFFRIALALFKTVAENDSHRVLPHKFFKHHLGMAYFTDDNGRNGKEKKKKGHLCTYQSKESQPLGLEQGLRDLQLACGRPGKLLSIALDRVATLL